VAVFAGLINKGKAAVSGLLLKYLARASVAIPFVIAVGVAIAAITVMLVERFGHLTAYWLMAGGLVAIGVMAAVAVSVIEREEEVAEQEAEAADTQQVAGDATAQVMTEAPLALLGTLFTAPGGATSAIKVGRILGRNWPLVLLFLMIGALFWPTDGSPEEAALEDHPNMPNGHHADTYH
jgi:hypothetical protein